MGAKGSKQYCSSSKREARAILTSDSRSSCMMGAIMRKRPPKNQKRASQSTADHQSRRMMTTKARKLITLEDWLLASPGPDGWRSAECLSGGELYVFKHFSRRIHPLADHDPQSGTQPLRREADHVSIPPTDTSFSVDDLSSSSACSSFSRSICQSSGKLKKKVSFRLPEEADIFLFYSPAET